MRITKTQLKQIIEEELNMVREAIDYDDPVYGADAETRHQADQGAEQFIKSHPKLKWASRIIKALYRMGFSIVEPHPAALGDAARERKASDEAGLQEGMENLTPENIKMVLDGLAQIGYVVVPVVATSVAITNAVHGKPDAEKEKADLYADAEQAVRDRRQNNP